MSWGSAAAFSHSWNCVLPDTPHGCTKPPRYEGHQPYRSPAPGADEQRAVSDEEQPTQQSRQAPLRGGQVAALGSVPWVLHDPVP